MKWILVWVVAGSSISDLPRDQEYSTREACMTAAEELNDLSESSGAGGRVPVTVRAGCVEVEEQ